METMKLRSHIGTDGILQIQTPTDYTYTPLYYLVTSNQKFNQISFF
ncbi:hypothetical protein [Nostoc sp. NMS4]|nr:hypothetical protein [Nostoc sp. NMS4]MBN3924067.1 hypothetical protein [Nostoc sp. NMS4]